MPKVDEISKVKTDPECSPQISILKRKGFEARGYEEILSSTRRYYERFADRYMNFYEDWLRGEGSFSDPKYKEGYETVANLLGKTVKPDQRIVDVGCGVGVWSTLMAEKGAHIFSLDNLSTVLQKSKERYVKFGVRSKTSLVISDGFYLPFEDGVFDGATLNWVLAHIPVPLNRKFMSEISGVVKEGGWLFVSDSYWRGQEGGKEQVQTREAEGGKYEVYKYYYDIDELRTLVEKTLGRIEVLQSLHYELICIAKRVQRY